MRVQCMMWHDDLAHPLPSSEEPTSLIVNVGQPDVVIASVHEDVAVRDEKMLLLARDRSKVNLKHLQLWSRRGLVEVGG